MAGVSSQGTYFSFGGAVYTATSITVNDGFSGGGSGGSLQRQRVSAATLASNPNFYEPYIPLWFPDPTGQGGGGEDRTKTVDVEFIGQTAPPAGTSGSISVTGRISVSGAATCTGSSIIAQTGDVVRGTASFRLRI
jgi:hypothetical protein